MILGRPEDWRNRFRSVDERLVERISVVWPKCCSVLSEQLEEDHVTENLVYLLAKDEGVRKLGWPEYQFVPFGMSEQGSVMGKGSIDLALILDQDRDRYMGYECKRLNVIYRATRHSQAGKYVDEGLMRFVKEQYSEWLPVGGMLGYVMDGDLEFAEKSVWKEIKKRRVKIKLVQGPGGKKIAMGHLRFGTTHSKAVSSEEIEIRHTFFAFH